jgi:TonB family protein
MTAHTLPSGQEHHFREREFKRSFTVSLVIHLVIFIAAGSVTLFRMSGTTYSPTYTVDLISLPPAPASRPAQVKAPARSAAKTPEKKPDQTVSPDKEPPPLDQSVEDLRPAGGDEAARLERRKRIEALELEARQLYESYTAEEAGEADESATAEEAGPVERPASDHAVSGGQASNLRFRNYYDQIIAQMRAAWVLPDGVAVGDKLLTVVGVTISPMGDIQNISIEKSSGNLYFDQSAIRAIRKASPLPPIPEELGDESLEVGGLNFKYPPE